MNTKKLLLVDDEVGLLELLTITFEKEHFTHITCATSAAEALELIHTHTFDLVLLDVGLPDFSGFDLCQEIRRHTYVPIIFLTARNSTLDKLSGLSMGGDDYMTKPFEPLEVVARAKALLRRQDYMSNTKPAKSQLFDYGRFKLHTDTAQLIVENKMVACTANEYGLLLFFCKNPNHIFTAAELYEAVWKEMSVSDDKTVSMQISRLRKKLGDTIEPLMIQNLRGIGYKFVPPTKEKTHED